MFGWSVCILGVRGGLNAGLVFIPLRAQSSEPRAQRVGPMPRSVRQCLAQWVRLQQYLANQVAPGFRATPGKKVPRHVLVYTDKVNTSHVLQFLLVVILRMTAPNYKVQIASNLKMLSDLSLQEKCSFSIKTRFKYLQKYPELYNGLALKISLCVSSESLPSGTHRRFNCVQLSLSPC